MHIVIYQSEHCSACQRVTADLIGVCRQLDAATKVRDILGHLEQAARLGITRPPAVIVDGRLFGQGNGVAAKLRRRCLS